MALMLQKFVFSPFMENTYVVWDDETKEAAIVDPGCYNEDEQSVLSEFIEDTKLNVKYLVNTHCHADHIFGNAFVKATYDVEFLAPEKDLFLLDNAFEQAEMFGVKISPSPHPDKFISEGGSIAIGNVRNEFIWTPGHTPGEVCIYFPDDKKCLTGDVLFKDSIGRTDLWGGDYGTLISSITDKLFILPDDVTIYPGHGDESTIGHEKQYNPYAK